VVGLGVLEILLTTLGVPCHSHLVRRGKVCRAQVSKGEGKSHLERFREKGRVT
jgi:hypothetical protein